jgi:hypothetical protein
MTRFTLVTVTLAIGGVIAVTQCAREQAPVSSTAAAQQQPSSPPTLMTGMAPGTPDGQVLAMHQEMMAHMAVINAEDDALQALIDRMNAAQGAAKVDAIAEVLTEMARQHRTMRDDMLEAQGQRMQMRATP